MKHLNKLFILVFILLLLTGCLTTRYTNPNLTITPEFKELDNSKKSMQIIIVDPENLYVTKLDGLDSEFRKKVEKEDFFFFFDKYFDWHIRDISTLKKVEFFKEDDNRSYDYTLYLSELSFNPYTYTTTTVSTTGQITKGETIKDCKYSAKYRLVDNTTKETVMSCSNDDVTREEDFVPTRSKNDEWVTKKNWKIGIRKFGKDIILNTPFYSKEKEDKSENKFYDFNKKTDFHKKTSLF